MKDVRMEMWARKIPASACFRFHSVRVFLMRVVILGLVNLVITSNSVSIWEVGDFRGKIPEKNASAISPRLFFEAQQHVPFIARGFHKTLTELADEAKFKGDPFEWLSEQIGGDAKMCTLEGELQETRQAPVIYMLKFKYFFEKFRKLDAYAVSQVPLGIRKNLQLLPFFACGGNSFGMQVPMMWISGGARRTKSVVHADSHHNQHCVLHGEKRFMLIPPHIPLDTSDYGWLTTQNEDGSMKEGFESAYGDFAAEIDYDNMDLDRFPKWKEVPWFIAELKAGDCLYMPIDWYHYVESGVGPAVTWHQWFRTQPEWQLQSDCQDNPDNPPGKVLTTDQCVFNNDKHVDRRVNKISFTENRTSQCTH